MVEVSEVGSRSRLQHIRYPILQNEDERLLDLARLDAPGDEDEARPAVLVRPGFQVSRPMHDVLDAVDEERPFPAHVEEALDPQDVLTARLQEHRQPDAEGGPVASVVRRTPNEEAGTMAKEIFCAYGIDVDAVAGWLGSYGG